MWRRRVCAEEQTGDQTGTGRTSKVTREVSAASIDSSKPVEIPVTRKKAVSAEKTACALPEIGNDHNIGLVVSGAGFDPCLPFAHVIGRSEICLPVSAPAFPTAELMNKKQFYHPSDRFGTLHTR